MDTAAACLLLLGLAYYWLGDTAHELIGTSLFLLLIIHNVRNRKWYGRVARTKGDTRSVVNIGATVVLVAGMAVLLVTSVMISKVLFVWLAVDSGFTPRQIHSFAAYLALIAVSVHLGLRWPWLIGVCRSTLGISKPNALRVWTLRLVAVAIACQGVMSWTALGVGAKLAMQMSLDWWNFEESTIGFFAHCLAVSGLVIVLTYYAMKLLQIRAGRETSTSPIA